MKLYFWIIAVFLSVNGKSQDCSDIKGTWINELGSALVIDSIGMEGEIIGHYASSTGVDGKVFPLNGWVNANDEFPEEVNISFMVKWEGYGSITSWTGYCHVENDKPQIKTIWNLVRSGKEFNWERIITNSSIFTPSAW